MLHSYAGQKQGIYVIRSAFGGPQQMFIISGSEDFNVYIWHREKKSLMESLSGHTGTVNSVGWSPTDPCLFVSASDDCTIRVWGKETLDTDK
jgi:WD repeat-containing protein 26